MIWNDSKKNPMLRTGFYSLQMTNSNLVPNKSVEFSSNQARILAMFGILMVLQSMLVESGMSTMVALHWEAEVADWCSKSDRHFLRAKTQMNWSVGPD